MSAFDTLAGEPRWVGWRNEQRGDGVTKVPYGAGCRHAKAGDPNTWVTRTEAAAFAKRIINGLGGGIGIELGDLGADVYLIGVDLDSCIERTEQGRRATSWAREIVAVTRSYTETSPSGNGLKVFAYAAAEYIRPFLRLISVPEDGWGCRRSVPGMSGAKHGPAVEVYCAARYFAVTEKHAKGAPENIAMLAWEQLEALAKLVPPPTSTNSKPNGQDNSRSAKAFREGARLRREGKSLEEFCEALRNHPDPDIRDWCRDKGAVCGGRELRRIWDKAERPEEDEGVSPDDFYAYMPMHSYIFAPTREMWPASSVNSRIPPIRIGKEEIKASLWLDQNRPVEQMTWAPGLPMLIDGKLISDGGWIDRGGVRCFNLYRPPSIKPGNAAQAGPWLNHVRRVYPNDADHIIAWLAHRVQRPHEKINHALVLGGAQGIGKDTFLEPVKRAIGPWNFSEPSPQQVMGRFNGFVKAVIIRINEARDLGEFDRFKFYDHTKVYTAAPPDALRVDEKHLREHTVFNVCGVIITTNHKTDGIYLPADDRRHYVAWSDLARDDFVAAYWDNLYRWYDQGGTGHVAAYLAELDLSDFNCKAPPPKTTAFWEIVEASHSPEDSELADTLDELGNPDVVRIQQIVLLRPNSPFSAWLEDRKNSRLIPHRFEKCGYTRVRNEAAKDGQWKVNGKRQAIYGRADLPFRDRYNAASDMAAGSMR